MDHAVKPLQGINVLVTRPEHQCAFLAEKIRELGGNPVVFPVLVISDITDKKPLLKLARHLDTYDFAIFVSPNAVHKAMPHILSCRQAFPPLPKNLQVAAVGNGTADALKTYNIDQVIVPKARFDSEALLELKAFQHVSGKRIVIFRGNDGRALLGDSLRERGALLEYIACYQRDKPDVDPSKLLLSWRQGKINAVIITSSEGLQNLIDILGLSGQQLLKKTPLFTTHERIANNAQNIGFKLVVKTSQSGDQGLLQGLLDYFNVSTTANVTENHQRC